MEVKAGRLRANRGLFGSGMTRNYDPQFVATQFQILQTTEILYPVIERLELVKEFSPVGQKLPMEQVCRRLRRAMQLNDVRNTALIDVGIYDTDHQRAANIANTIGVVYVERRRADLQKSCGSRSRTGAGGSHQTAGGGARRRAAKRAELADAGQHHWIPDPDRE